MDKRKFIVCPGCGGEGSFLVPVGLSYSGNLIEEAQTCERCGGSGEIEIETDAGRGADEK